MDVTRIKTSMVLRFLVLGGTAALINWLARFPLAVFLPGNAAIVGAYFIGMATGFTLYRRFVFPTSDVPVTQQILTFLAVNAVGAIVVLLVTGGTLFLLPSSVGPDFAREGAAHGFGIGVGAIVNFYGHKLLTFRSTASRISGAKT